MDRRPRSGRVRSARGAVRKISASELHDLARNPNSLLSLAASYEEATKSAVEFSKASKVNLSRQAWAPPAPQSLASSSSRFQTEPPFPFNLYVTDKPPRARGAFGRAEDHICLEDLEKFRKRFEEADRNGNGTLDEEEFMEVFDKVFGLKGKNEEEMRTFFHKIDYDSDGYIDWDEFCTYMYLELHEREDAQSRAKKVEFQVPAIVPSSPHRDSICRISHLSDNSLVSCSQDGVVCLWTHDFEPKRVRNVESGRTGKPKWVTDMALCIPQSKILLTTGDHEIQFYEMVNFEPYCQLKRLEAVPLKVSYWCSPQQQNECIITVGDQEGAVTVFMIPNIQEAFKHWKLAPKSEEGLPTYSIDRLVSDALGGTKVYRWKLHSNWVSEVHYFPELHCFASCSSDSLSSLVLGSPSGSTQVEVLLHISRQISVVSSRPRSALPAKQRVPGDQRVFRAPKGICTVDYCPKHNVVVTGSVDQVIRIWNPFVTSKPIASLFGQGSPVFCVRVDSPTDRIFSVGNDNTVKVWDIVDYHCHCTLIPSVHKVFTPAEAAHVVTFPPLLALGTDQLAVLKLDSETRREAAHSHTHPVTAIRYSKCFNQIVTACDSGVVKVWELTTGACMFEFTVNDEGIGVSAIDIEPSGRRLITADHRGRIKLWSYNNGCCIRSLDKGNCKEVTDVKFITIHLNRYIIAVGWDRKITLFMDGAGSMQKVQKPIEAWSSATEHAHIEDILSVAFGSPHLMATASFDGEIIVWSVISCHILSRLKALPPGNVSSTLQGDEAVQKLLFLNKRSKSRTAATLVASGPAGHIHFWNIYDSSQPMGHFIASQYSCVTAMAVDSSNSVLISADIEGFIALWSIKGYCISSHATQIPRRVAYWRGHTKKITSLELVEEWNVLVSASMDTTVRLWTLQGHYIGMFGQEVQWHLGEPSSYQHPLGPTDVLLDPLSVPRAAQLPGGQAMEKEETRKKPPDQKRPLGHAMSITEIEDDQEEKTDALLASYINLCVPSQDDASIGVGKRLRHIRTHSARTTRSSTSGVYRNLVCQPLSDEPHFSLPATCNVQTIAGR